MGWLRDKPLMGYYLLDSLCITAMTLTAGYPVIGIELAIRMTAKATAGYGGALLGIRIRGN
nr:hypothetical protein [uncultured Desulfobulbus sp.]